MSADTTVDGAKRAGRRAKDHPLLDVLVRIGLVCYGLVYLALAWLALQLLLGDRDERISKDGALHQLTEQSMGAVVMWAAVVGFAALVLWQLLEAAVGHTSKQGGKRLWARLTSVFRAVVYAVLGFAAAKVATGEKQSGENTDGYTAQLMSLPFGPWLVAAVGLAVIAYGVGSVVKGLTDGYEDELDLDGRTGLTGSAIRVLARIGYCGRGAAFGVVGGLFVWAAATHDADKSGGLDAALGRLLTAPLGPVLVGIIAAGFACYGLFNVLLFRHHRS
jgi:hypothetical protein